MPGWNASHLFLISVAVKSIVVLSLAWLTTLVLRRGSAGMRHLVWTAASAALLALPFLSLSLPKLNVPAVSALLSESLPAFRITAVDSSTQSTTPRTDATTFSS